jgi:hypothetical protein
MSTDFFTTSLFATPSAVTGAARALDMGGIFNDYNYEQSAEEADDLALFLDFSTVHQELSRSILFHYEKYERDQALQPALDFN